MSVADIIIACIIGVLAAAAVCFLIIRRKKGKGCSYNCENCAFNCDKRH